MSHQKKCFFEKNPFLFKDSGKGSAKERKEKGKESVGSGNQERKLLRVRVFPCGRERIKGFIKELREKDP